MRRTIFLFFTLLFFLHFSTQAQLIGPKNDTTGRNWNIRFVIDGGMFPLSISSQDKYEGERLENLMDSDGNYYQEWQWASWDTAGVHPSQDYRTNQIRLGILINVVENLYVGVNYSAYILKRWRREQGYTYFETIPFITLAGSVTYSWQIPGVRALSLEPNFSVGTYQSDLYYGYEGIGRELSLEGRLALGLRLSKKKDHMFRMWVSYANFDYLQHSPSFVYENRTREIHTNWQFVNMGFGLNWHIGFREDPPDPEGKLKKLKKEAKRKEKKKKKE